MNKEEIKYLESFIVDNRDLERLESLIAQFNVFEAIGAIKQELRHSDFLSFLLNPSNNHGLGDIFLKNTLKQILMGTEESGLSAIDVDIANMADAEIRREWRNIDILILSPGHRVVCAIENKIGTSEHSKQLQRYRKIVLDSFKNYRPIFVYLTPEGDYPSDDSWIPYSYTAVANLLENFCRAHQSSMGADIHTLIWHYVTMLRRHIVSDSEIAKLCRKIYNHHKKALDLIYEHKPDLQLELSEFLKSLIKEKNQNELNLDHSSKSYVRFYLTAWDKYPNQHKGGGWTSSKRILLFEFQNNLDSLVLKLIIGPGNKNARENLYKIASQNPDAFSGMSKKLYDKFTQIYKKDYLKSKDYEDINWEDLKEKLRKKWEAFLKNDFIRLTEKISFSDS
jgi:hypothetical protein